MNMYLLIIIIIFYYNHNYDGFDENPDVDELDFTLYQLMEEIQGIINQSSDLDDLINMSIYNYVRDRL